MSRFASADGRPRIVLCDTIADMAAPDITEIEAGDDLSAFLTKDGFSTGEAGNRAPASGAAEQYNLDVAGSVNLAVSTTFFRDDESDDAWDAYERGDTKFIVFCRKGGSGEGGAIAAGDEVEVYHGEALDKSNADIAENTTSRFTTNWSTKSAPEMSAVVTSS